MIKDKTKTINPEAYLSLAKKISCRISKNFSPTGVITREDLEQEAYLGLIEAAKSYNPEICDSFEAYANIRITGALKDYLRNQDMLTRSHRKALKMSCEEGITFEDACEIIGLSERQIQKYQTTPSETISIDNAEDEYIPSDYRVEEVCENKEYLNFILREANLTEKEMHILKLYFYSGMKQNEIAQMYGLTSSRMSQKIAQILSKCKKVAEATI